MMLVSNNISDENKEHDHEDGILLGVPCMTLIQESSNETKLGSYI
jgi:hypothetical protein